MTKNLCFATNNQHKIKEVADLLGGHCRLLSLHEIGFDGELAEDFFTLQDNSRQKAEFVFRHFNVACFADDTGLEVVALNGEPGVFSARYAGPQRNSDDNMTLLLQKLANQTNRNARFRTVITLFESDATVKQFEGTVEGEILTERRGTEGFGYDPIFLPHGSTKTLAEMSMAEKNVISHRARAMNKLVGYLKTRD